MSAISKTPYNTYKSDIALWLNNIKRQLRIYYKTITSHPLVEHAHNLTNVMADYQSK